MTFKLAEMYTYLCYTKMGVKTWINSNPDRVGGPLAGEIDGN